MLLINYEDKTLITKNILTEVDVGGEPVDPPDQNNAAGGNDYTAGRDNPEPAEDAGADPEADDQEETDYTDDTGGDNPDADPGDDPDAEGGGEEDYTDDAGGDDPEGGDTGGDGQVQADDARGLENELFKDLTKDQIDIKHRELKSNFTDLYNSTSNIIDRVNAIPNNDNYMQAIAFVSKQLSSLRQMIADYMTNVYSTKSYMENTVNYNRFLATLKGINDILDEINKDINS